MKVILLQNIKSLGQANDVVEVADGFARNFLLRRNLAKAADAAALSDLQRQKASREAKSKAEAEKARGLAGKIEKLELEITPHGTAAGTLYAGLKESAILARLRKSVSNLSETARLLDYQPIKSLGDHEVLIELAPGVRAPLKLRVTTNAKK